MLGMTPEQVIQILGGKDILLQKIFDNVPKIAEFLKDVITQIEQGYKEIMTEGGFTSIGWDITLIKGEVRFVLAAKKYRKKGDGIVSKVLEVYSLKGFIHHVLKEIQTEKIEDGKKD